MKGYTISQIRILNIMKMWFLPGLIHGFIELPIKILLGIAVDIDKLIFKTLYGNAKGQEQQGSLEE